MYTLTYIMRYVHTLYIIYNLIVHIIPVCILILPFVFFTYVMLYDNDVMWLYNPQTQLQVAHTY